MWVSQGFKWSVGWMGKRRDRRRHTTARDDDCICKCRGQTGATWGKHPPPTNSPKTLVCFWSSSGLWSAYSYCDLCVFVVLLLERKPTLLHEQPRQSEKRKYWKEVTERNRVSWVFSSIRGRNWKQIHGHTPLVWVVAVLNLIYCNQAFWSELH